MATPATIDEFLEIVRKSNQVDYSRVEAYFHAHRPKLPNHPKKLALALIQAKLMTGFQAEQFLLGKYKGFCLGGYRVLERIGSGGSGMVYLAEHEVLKRQVALKVLPAPFAENPSVLERFKREAQAAAVLDHPNIVRVFDLRQEGSLHYIVMEYIAGPTLQQILLRRKTLLIEVACEYTRQAALGLQHAHELGLVHRDIKPANILVDVTGVVKILDLGLARFESEGENSLTRKFNSHMVLGTADYLAPEQAMDLHSVDGRADIYSLGATLYALLTGRPPFDSGTIGQKLLWHQTQIPVPVNALRPEIPVELAGVVAKMLAKNPDDRFQSAAEVAQVLLPWAEKAPLPAVSLTRSVAELHLEPPHSALQNTRTDDNPMEQGVLAPDGDTWIDVAKNDTVPMNQVDKLEPLQESEFIDTQEFKQQNDSPKPSRQVIYGLCLGILAVVGGAMYWLLW